MHRKEKYSYNLNEYGFRHEIEKMFGTNQLERIHEINNKYYTLLLEKETEYELSKAGITTYNEILKPAPLNDNAISPKPISLKLFSKSLNIWSNNFCEISESVSLALL